MNKQEEEGKTHWGCLRRGGGFQEKDFACRTWGREPERRNEKSAFPPPRGGRGEGRGTFLGRQEVTIPARVTLKVAQTRWEKVPDFWERKLQKRKLFSGGGGGGGGGGGAVGGCFVGGVGGGVGGGGGGE